MRLQKNLEKWSKSHPKEAVLLANRSNNALIWGKTEKGELNLFNARGNEKWPYHDSKGALQEANEWFEKLDLKGVEILYVYGVGLGYLYLVLLPWLRKKRGRSVCFFEDDLDVIHHLFETEAGSKLIRDPRVHLIYFNELTDLRETFFRLFWNFSLQPLLTAALPSYQQFRKEESLAVCHQIVYDSVQKNTLLHEFQERGIPYYRNFFLNMLWLDRSYQGLSFFGQFPKIPAIICGAGPSLEKQIPLLSQIKNRALIFAGGSAMNVLNSFNIQPHFGVGIDPNFAQFERLNQNSAFEVPYFYRNRLFHYAFLRIHGPKLYMAGSDAYETSKYYEEKMDILPEIEVEEGVNVISFSAQIAKEMGCDPIIFVGMDLGFTDLKLYSPGIEKESPLDPHQFSKIKRFEDQPLLKTDIYGKPLYTLWKWIYESDWFSEFAKLHPHLTILNATEGGLGFADVENISLSDVFFRYLTKDHNLDDAIFSYIQQGTMEKVDFPTLKKLTHELSKSHQKALSILEGLIEEIEKMETLIEKTKTPLDSLETGRSALLGTELEELLSFEYVLKLFFLFIQRFLLRDSKSIKRRVKPLPLWKQQLKLLSISKKQMAFLHQSASDNLSIIRLSEKEIQKERPSSSTPPLKSARLHLRHSKNIHGRSCPSSNALLHRRAPYGGLSNQR